MILLFTSDKCTWCEVLKTMILEEGADLVDASEIFEVNIDRYQFISEAYAILTVPTLIAGTCMLSGVPSSGDLRSFLLQAMAGGLSDDRKNRPRYLLQSARQIRQAAKETKEPPPLERTALPQ